MILLIFASLKTSYKEYFRISTLVCVFVCRFRYLNLETENQNK